MATFSNYPEEFNYPKEKAISSATLSGLETQGGTSILLLPHSFFPWIPWKPFSSPIRCFLEFVGSPSPSPFVVSLNSLEAFLLPLDCGLRTLIEIMLHDKLGSFWSSRQTNRINYERWSQYDPFGVILRPDRSTIRLNKYFIHGRHCLEKCSRRHISSYLSLIINTLQSNGIRACVSF